MQLDKTRFLEACGKFTQQEIGEHLGMTQVNVGRVLRTLDKDNLRLKMFLDICVLLEEDPSTFLVPRTDTAQ